MLDQKQTLRLKEIQRVTHRANMVEILLVGKEEYVKQYMSYVISLATNNNFSMPEDLKQLTENTAKTVINELFEELKN